VLGDFLKGRRKAARLSQTKLAQATGIPQTYISRIERGEVGLPHRATRDKFHAVLGTTEREWLDAAGEFGVDELPGEVTPPLLPLPIEGDRQFDPAQLVAFVEAKPDPSFREKLARQKARRTPESYARLCLRIYRAWTSNADLVIDELEEIAV
jgi:transcriptional regulator with XRE-family HTH domain